MTSRSEHPEHLPDVRMLRDEFAMAAMQAMHHRLAEIFTASLFRPEDCKPGEEREYVEKRIASLCGACYAIADGMMRERNRP